MAREDRKVNSMKDTAWRSPDHSGRAGLKSGLQEAESLIARIGERRRFHQPLSKPSAFASVLTSIPRSKAEGARRRELPFGGLPFPPDGKGRPLFLTRQNP